jgi:hypothetical protein
MKGRSVGASLRRFRQLLWIIASLTQEIGSAAGPSELELKAAFLFKFVTYTEWPSPGITPPGGPVVIGVFADGPSAETIGSTVGTNRVRGHPVAVRRIRAVQEAAECHLVFVAGEESARLPELITLLRSRPVLLVGDGDRFCRAGGMIAFRLVEGKMRFEVEGGRVAASGLKVSSQLLKLSLPPAKAAETPGGAR